MAAAASSSSSLQEARAGVAERWIASHAGSVTNDSPQSSASSSPTHSVWPANPHASSTGIPNPTRADPSSNNTVLNGSPPSGLYGFGSVLGNNRGRGPPKTGYFDTAHYTLAPNPFPKLFSGISNIKAESFRVEPGLSRHEHKNRDQVGPLKRGLNNGEYGDQRSNGGRYGQGSNEPHGQEPDGNEEQYAAEGRSKVGGGEENGSSPNSFVPLNFNEKLYEAYDDLHCLAQSFRKPFDAPAILVVGHQTDGKSALVEALMGFQFNHVGGGTKTRRPITLHMKYNVTCLEPVCFLVSDSGDEEKSLEELQAYIEAENMRLERDPCQFSAQEIIVKIEYKYCPNLTIIDTPGLIAAPPSRKNQLLQAQARAVEALVRTKMQSKEFIILCLEDCSDWSNATTRRIVMQMDQELTRTVVVSTKLDTRIPQFARAADVELFLRPPHRLLDGNILGDSPFFTSVPSGRVGGGRDSVYRSNDQFREAIAMREAQDVKILEEKLDRPLSPDERAHVGVSRLRWFLEQILQQRYLESVPLVVPLLDKEYWNASRKLQQTNQDLGELDEARLKEKGRLFRDSFLAKLSLLLKGTVVAPPEKFGEALQDERINGGAFVGSDGLQMPFKYMPNAGMRLYGGAQYHRAMAEFRFVVGSMKCPAITREEIVNACGVEDIHDGTNYFRTACVIAVAKARDVFEPFLYQLGFRLSHILRRLLPIALYLLQKDGEYLSGHNMFMKRVSAAFYSFVETTERGCREKCMEDLMSTTRYVTWSLHNKNRSGLHQFLDTFPTSDSSSILSTNGSLTQGLDAGTIPTSVGSGNKQDGSKSRQELKGNPSASTIETTNNQTTQARLVDLLESTLWNRRLAPSSEEIVNALVAQIFDGIRDHFVTAAELKFNCFFLMPVVEKFPALLRDDLEAAFEEDLDSVFDVVQARRALEQQRVELELEMKKVERLQEKFMSIHKSLSSTVTTMHLPRKDISSEIALLKVSEKLTQ